MQATKMLSSPGFTVKPTFTMRGICYTLLENIVNKKDKPSTMKQYLTLLFASFILSAEWEQQDAVWLGWEEDSQRGYNPAVKHNFKNR